MINKSKIMMKELFQLQPIIKLKLKNPNYFKNNKKKKRN